LELGPEVAPRIIALAWHRNRYGQAAAEAFIDQAVHTAESLASRAA
jgi:DNA-binding transcriptional LysR family regulator